MMLSGMRLMLLLIIVVYVAIRERRHSKAHLYGMIYRCY